MKFGRKILESYLSIAIVVLTVVSFTLLKVLMSGKEDPGVIFLSLLMIILISVNILNAIIQLRMLERIGFIALGKKWDPYGKRSQRKNVKPKEKSEPKRKKEKKK